MMSPIEFYLPGTYPPGTYVPLSTPLDLSKGQVMEGSLALGKW